MGGVGDEAPHEPLVLGSQFCAPNFFFLNQLKRMQTFLIEIGENFIFYSDFDDFFCIRLR